MPLQHGDIPMRVLLKKDTGNDNNPFKLKFADKEYYNEFEIGHWEQLSSNLLRIEIKGNAASLSGFV